MRVCVIGAGGVGGFFGAVLSRAGHEVSFLARGNHLAAIRERGLELQSTQLGNFSVRPKASDNPSDLDQADFVLIAVKMYDFDPACQIARNLLNSSGLALTIQNGLDAPYQLAEVIGANQARAGTVAIEARILEPGVIAHPVHFHQLVIADISGPPTKPTEDLAAELKRSGLNASVAQDSRQALWDKAAPLIPFATLTAAAECSLAEIMSGEMQTLFTALKEEAVAVASADGHDVQPTMKAYTALLEKMQSSAPAFTSSLNRDFLAGKRVELEWLTGKLVSLARQYGVAVPAHQALYAVLQLKALRQAREREATP